VRHADWNALSTAYEDANRRPDQRLADALGLSLVSVYALHETILADLTEGPFGIGWWAPHPGTSRRILISDHLLQCVGTIPKNLTEARLHLLELSDWWERESIFLADSVTLGPGGRPRVKLPARQKATDDLPQAMASLHLSGFFQAVWSALDCLSAGIIGVLALPFSIRRADFDRTIAHLRTLPDATAPGTLLQRQFRDSLETLIANCGPPFWFDWTRQFRNTFAHRARRLHFGQLVPTSTLYGPDGKPIIRTRVIQHLPRDPDLSDIEALRFRDRRNIVVREPAETTLSGIAEGVRQLIDGASEALLISWRTRRATPTMLQQPREQWPEGSRQPAFDFSGYAPGMTEVDPGAYITSPEAPRRLRAAALTDDLKGRWQGFD
jgi:hypothetical protein